MCRRLLGSQRRGVGSRDRAALVALYHATDAANWTNSQDWLSESRIREWTGVGAYFGRVTALRLSENGLTGAIPPELGLLSDLVRLELGKN